MNTEYVTNSRMMSIVFVVAGTAKCNDPWNVCTQPYVHCNSTQKQNQHLDILSSMPWLGFENKGSGITNKNNYADFNVEFSLVFQLFFLFRFVFGHYLRCGLQKHYLSRIVNCLVLLHFDTSWPVCKYTRIYIYIYIVCVCVWVGLCNYRTRIHFRILYNKNVIIAWI